MWLLSIWQIALLFHYFYTILKCVQAHPVCFILFLLFVQRLSPCKGTCRVRRIRLIKLECAYFVSLYVWTFHVPLSYNISNKRRIYNVLYIKLTTGGIVMIIPRHYENLHILHENTMPDRNYYIPAGKAYSTSLDARDLSDRVQSTSPISVSSFSIFCSQSAIRFSNLRIFLFNSFCAS